jgi:hypothetical protein
MLIFGVVTPCGLVRTNVSEEHTASIFKAVCFSEMLVSTYKSTRRYNPEDKHRHLYRRKNRTPHISLYSFFSSLLFPLSFLLSFIPYFSREMEGRKEEAERTKSKCKKDKHL